MIDRLNSNLHAMKIIHFRRLFFFKSLKKSKPNKIFNRLFNLGNKEFAWKHKFLVTFDRDKHERPSKEEA